jgi:hypothetical protein
MAFDWTSLIGPAIGAYAGYKAGGDTTTTQAPPPEWMGQWNAYTNFANQVANRPYQNTVAPFSQDQYGAMDQIRRQSQGGPEQAAGSQALQGILSGANKNPYMGNDNPYMKGLIQNTNDEVQNRMGTAAFSSGSFGNSGVAGQTAKALADSTNNLQYQQYQNSANLYENQMNRQMQAVPQALNYQNQNLANSSALLQSGAMQQAQGQKTVDQWWNYPQQQLAAMGSPLGFNTGRSTTEQGNPYASALGGGLLGLQMANNLYGQTPTTPAVKG